MILARIGGPDIPDENGRLRKLVLMPDIKIKAHFIELSHRTENLPRGGFWAYELPNYTRRFPLPWRLRAGGRVQLRSRNDKDFNVRYRLNKSLGMPSRLRRDSAETP
jgi:hypothetical protein